MAKASKKAKRGFAAMDKEKQRAIASRGGAASGANFKHDPARASLAGSKDGKASRSGAKNDLTLVTETSNQTEKSIA